MTRRARIAAGVLAGVLAVTSCGVPDDSEPRALPPEVSDLLAPTTPPVTTSGTEDTTPLYFLEDQRLVRVDRRTDRPSSPEEVFELLLAGPTEDEQNAGLTSNIPADANLLGATPDSDGVLVIQLGPKLGTITGTAAKAAYAQLMLTADAIGWDRVRFVVDGKPVDAPTDDGNQRVVQASDYSPPLNPG